MAKGFYVGVDNKARKAKKMYVGVDGKARKIKKVYIGVDGKARLCYSSGEMVVITYSSSLSLSYTSKTVEVGKAYGAFPLTANSNRVDFWFESGAKAKKDSSKSYANYPWCAYADANSDLYSAYGYDQGRLAQHWNERGASEGRSLGGVTATTICTKETNHTLQHSYTSKKVAVTNSSKDLKAMGPIAYLYHSDGTQVVGFSIRGDTPTYTAYPGMYFVFYVEHNSGLLGRNSSKITINGTTVATANGNTKTYKYVIPNNLKTLTMNCIQDEHADGGWSWINTITTTTI